MTSKSKLGHHAHNNGLKLTGEEVDDVGCTIIPLQLYNDAIKVPATTTGAALTKSLLPGITLHELFDTGNETEDQQPQRALQSSLENSCDTNGNLEYAKAIE